MVTQHRKTKETDISLELALGNKKGTGAIDSGIPFFDHLLGAFALHGNIYLKLKARGDLMVDYHHTVEDIGLILGDSIAELYGNLPQMMRFGHAVVPMDDSLAEVTLDLCNRPYCVYQPILPQQYILDFDTSLIKEFFTALSGRARITLHLSIRHAENSHHAIEALFKAFGMSFWRACQPRAAKDNDISTKGGL